MRVPLANQNQGNILNVYNNFLLMMRDTKAIEERSREKYFPNYL